MGHRVAGKMSKKISETLIVSIADHQKVIKEQREAWTKRVLKACGLTTQQIDIGFSDDTNGWQDIAAIAGIEILLLTDGSTEIIFGRNNPLIYHWKSPQVVKMKETVAGKRTLLLNWTEPE